MEREALAERKAIRKETDMERVFFAVVTTLALQMLSAFPASAQASVDPTGHWNGVMEAQGQQFTFDIDFVKTAAGAFAGAVSIPAQHIKGLPLRVSIDGRSIQFYARRDQVFRGDFAPDGKSISGEFAAEGMTLTYTLTRAGDSQFAGPAKSPAVTGALEGTWNGVVEPGGRSAPVTLTIANQPDGTSTGTLVNEAGLELPLTITEAASVVTLTVTVPDASFAGELSMPGELAGTWTEGEKKTPVTFKRVAR
jgi:hypothetical protein